MVAGGAVAGTAAAIAGAPSARPFHVSPADPIAICSALLVVALVTFLALQLPARRATRVHPMKCVSRLSRPSAQTIFNSYNTTFAVPTSKQLVVTYRILDFRADRDRSAKNAVV